MATKKIKVRNRANKTEHELTEEQYEKVSSDKFWNRTFEKIEDATPPEVKALEDKKAVEPKKAELEEKKSEAEAKK